MKILGLIGNHYLNKSTKVAAYKGFPMKYYFVGILFRR